MRAAGRHKLATSGSQHRALPYVRSLQGTRHHCSGKWSVVSTRFAKEIVYIFLCDYRESFLI